MTTPDQLATAPCGDLIWTAGVTPTRCTLPGGHADWHRADNGMSWSAHASEGARAAYARGVAEGRRQATEGWKRQWAVDLGGSWPMHPCDSEADARRLAAYRDGRTVVSRLVGPWEADEQAERVSDGPELLPPLPDSAYPAVAVTLPVELAEGPHSPAAKMRSLRAHPHGSACICDDCTARDEAARDAAHMAAMEERHQHEDEQAGGDR